MANLSKYQKRIYQLAKSVVKTGKSAHRGFIKGEMTVDEARKVIDRIERVLKA
jgi:hypothetical protein